MIHLSAAAASEIVRLRSRRKLPNLLFRLGIQPSHCLPLAYTIGFDDAVQPNDRVYECEGVQIVINQDTLPYVDGLVLDYSEDLMGGGFRFHNPNAVQNCGCGNSFAVAESSEPLQAVDA
jgi:iron-sulfur cluster assembly accessory protein